MVKLLLCGNRETKEVSVVDENGYSSAPVRGIRWRDSPGSVVFKCYASEVRWGEDGWGGLELRCSGQDENQKCQWTSPIYRNVDQNAGPCDRSC